MRNKNPSKAHIKCFFCTKPIGDEHVEWVHQEAVRKMNVKGRDIKDSDSIFLHPDCAIQLGQRLMIDGFKGNHQSFKGAMAILRSHLRDHQTQDEKMGTQDDE